MFQMKYNRGLLLLSFVTFTHTMVAYIEWKHRTQDSNLQQRQTTKKVQHSFVQFKPSKERKRIKTMVPSLDGKMQTQ